MIFFEKKVKKSLRERKKVVPLQPFSPLRKGAANEGSLKA